MPIRNGAGARQEDVEMRDKATWQELNDPWNEWNTETLDFDSHQYEDSDWWKQQDDELEQEEKERIENQADEDTLRRFGYWD
jgi:hypothetical protein